jgi:hypothetical protein
MHVKIVGFHFVFYNEVSIIENSEYHTGCGLHCIEFCHLNEASLMCIHSWSIRVEVFHLMRYSWHVHQGCNYPNSGNCKVCSVHL